MSRTAGDAIAVRGDDRAALCIHGLGGTPFEVRPLAEGLASVGATVEAPVLAGHGRTMDDLERSRWIDWLGVAEDALVRLRSATGRRVAVAGFSMGGLLALRLAQLRPAEVSAVAVISTPVRLPLWQRAVLRAMGHLPAPLRRGWLRVIPKLAGCDVSDQEAKRANPSLPGFPVRTLLELVDLQNAVRAELPRINQPAFVAHGRKDHTVRLRDSLVTATSLRSEIIETLWLDQSFHLVLIDVERQIVVDRITNFFAHYGWGA